ncbi:hypothetical protein PEDI_25520 [Persicobacter diffluens]|uniref:O-antigen ligase domain-containing protein n=2 Tax=Persicobacter diffluens TaxID=981 RepID=A0AAN4W153_9BACT|nr:hypothetical protein PEDI_25520 [Persicobacter diffluens]
MVFDGVRSRLVFGAILSPLRDIAWVALLGICLINNRFRVSSRAFNIGIWLFFGYLALFSSVSVVGAIFNSFFGLTIFLKYFQFPIFLLLFLNYEHLTNFPYEKLIRITVRLMVLFVYVNIIFFTVDFHIFDRFRPWYGRISHGYPTMDCITLCYGLILYLFSNVKNDSKMKFIFVFFTFLLGIGMQVTGTGSVALLFILLGVFILFILDKHFFLENKRKSMVLVLLFFLCCFWGGIMVLKQTSPLLFEKIQNVAISKIQILTGEGASTVNNTVDIRKEQYELAKRRFVKNEIEATFGVGTGRFLLSTTRSDRIFIENQFDANLIAFGFVGEAFFLFMIFCMFLEAFQLRLWRYRMYMLLITLVFAFNSYTLISLYLFSNACGIAFVYGFYRKNYI